MPVGPQINVTSNPEAAGLLLQTFAIRLLQEQESFYLENRVTPWFGLFAPLWTRYTEIAVGRRPQYNYDNYGPYETIPALDDQDRKRRYFAELGVAMANGMIFRSVMKGSDGIYKRNIDIDFVVKCGGSEEPDTAEIVLYNVDPNISYPIEKAPIVIRSGYAKCYDAIFSGIIQEIEPKYEESGAAIKIKAVSNFRAFMGRLGFSRSYPIGTKYMTIINDLVALLPIPIGYIYPTSKVTEDYAFVTASDTTIKYQFDRLSEILGYTYTYQGGKFYFAPRGGPYLYAMPFPKFKLSALTGLLSVQKQTEEENINYSVTTLLLPYYGIYSLLDLDSKRFKHLELKVNEIEFRSDEASHYAIMKCESVVAY